MSSTRNFKSPGIFANDASTVIPPTPIAGVAYRDAVSGVDDVENGWRYGTRVESQDWNQIMFLATSVLSSIDKKGVLGWSDQVDYTEPAVAFGSDGVLYSWVQESGPTGSGAKDPISNPAYWSPALGGRLISTQVFTASGTYTPSAGMKKAIIEVQGGGGSGAGATVPTAGNVSIGAPGVAGSYAKGSFSASAIGASQAVTIGAAGSVSSGGAGGNGGSSSVGALIIAPGGTGGPILNNSLPPVYNGNGVPSGAPTGGNISSSIGKASYPSTAVSASVGLGGFGGHSQFGAGGDGGIANAPGEAALNYGAGGGGCMISSGGSIKTGALGKSGIVIIYEYA